jgi:hypothetical protein
MNKKQFLFIAVISFLTISSASIPYVVATIQADYYQDLELNSLYTYEVVEFDSVLKWWGLDYTNKGDAKINPGDEILIEIIGFSSKHSNDFSPFPDPAPYLNVIFESNTTFSNVANTEVAFVFAMGFNYFTSGFLIPINVLDDVKAWASENAFGFVNGTVTIEETLSTIEFKYEADNDSQNTTLIYDKTTGLLRQYIGENLYGPDIELNLITPLDGIPGFPIESIIGIICVITVIYAVKARKRVK